MATPREAPLSTKDPRIEAALKAKSAPKAGEPGAPMMGYAEVERLNNPDPGPAEEISAMDDAVDEVEKLSGKPIGELTEAEFMRIPVKLAVVNKYSNTDLHVVFKDPAMTGCWINFKHEHGNRVTRAYNQGFTACTKQDVDACSARATDENGSLVSGDLVLLKIPKIILWSMRKQNQETAKARVNKAYQDPRAAALRGDSDAVSRPGAEFFIPDIASAQHVDANEARKLVYS
jgi:hypothetical protein